MIVYLDIVIISNIIVNYALIKSIYLIYREKIKYIRLVISLLVSVFSLLLFIIPWESLYNARYFIGIIIGVIAFPYTNVKDVIIKIVLYYFLNLAFIGTLVIFNIHNFFIMLVALFYVVILLIIENYKNISIKQINYYYSIEIGNKRFTGYLDTGNQVYYKGVPVVFIRRELIDSMFKLLGTTSINTIANQHEIAIYEGPLLMIHYHKKHYQFFVYYALGQSQKEDIILNQDLEGGLT